MKWRQRAKLHWLNHGDKNTKFFHLHAYQRHKTNRVSQLLDSNGDIITDQIQLDNLFSSFNIQLFTSSNPHSIEDCLHGLSNCVTAEMNNYLSACFTEFEFTCALFQINPLGASSPKEFSTHFFQKH